MVNFKEKQEIPREWRHIEIKNAPIHGQKPCTGELQFKRKITFWNFQH